LSARLREAIRSNVAFCETKTDAGITVLNGVLLLRAGPGNLADRHWYTKNAIEDAVNTKVFEGAQAYLDHPSSWDDQVQPGRSVEKLAGYYSDIVTRAYDDPEVGPTTGLFANFHPEIGKPQVLSILRTCVEYARRYPRMAYAGLSIYASGDSVPDTIEGEEWNRVDRIYAVTSVDIVTRAGAGGTLVPLKESYFGMKTQKNGRGTTATDNVKLTLDADAAKEGVKKLFEGVGKKLVESIKGLAVKDGKVELTKEQEAEIVQALAFSEVEKVFDENTSVQEDEKPVEAAAADDPEDDDDVTDLPDDPKVLKAKLKKERASRKAAEGKAGLAESRATEAETRATEVSLTRMGENVLSALEIPDDFRPRILLEFKQLGYTRERDMREHAQAFDKAFIRRTDSAGVVSGGGSAPATGGGNFNFEED
jgi:hypothetical protein